MERYSDKKIKVPFFRGQRDPDAYLEWETKIEQFFQCNTYSNVQKVQVAALEFKDYALVWWDQTIKERRRYGDPPIETWEEMKRIMRRRYAPSYHLKEIQRKKVEKIEAEKILQRERKRERENRKKEMMERIERGMADISRILEENLFQIQNDYRESRKKDEKKECDEKEVNEKEERKEGVEEVEKKEEKKERENENHEKNNSKFWPTITLVPSSKLLCVFKCWDSSSNIIQLPNISLCHEGNKANEEKIPQQVEENFVLWKDDYVHKSQGEEDLTNSINQTEEFSKVEIACHEFYRVIFDPGGIQAINSRSNSLEEGEYDENLILSLSLDNNNSHCGIKEPNYFWFKVLFS